MSSVTLLLTAAAAIGSVLYAPVKDRYEVFGFGRSLKTWQNVHGSEIYQIPNTVVCEDLHLHEPSGLLFTACDGVFEPRFRWFPPTVVFDEPQAIPTGSIYVIDPSTRASTKLELEGFAGPFSTHGIDILSDPDDSESIYIYAVNHLPNPEWTSSSNASVPKARSQLEMFKHKLGSTTATYLRSVWHPLIRTPNDLLAVTPTTIFVTNDHYYREGVLRELEDPLWQNLGGWADVVHIQLSTLDSADSSSGVQATIALKNIHNSNGLGKGRDEMEILVCRAAAGRLTFTKWQMGSTTLTREDEYRLPSTIDNPVYFRDPYAASTGKDYSGYLLGGLGLAKDFAASGRDPNVKQPTMVWYLPDSIRKEQPQTTEPKLIFSDDGNMLRTAATAVLVAIDPAKNDGKREGWLFVTGSHSPTMIATKIALESLHADTA